MASPVPSVITTGSQLNMKRPRPSSPFSNSSKDSLDGEITAMLESHLEETTKATNGIGLMVRNTVSAYHEELKKEKDKNAGVETHNKDLTRQNARLAGEVAALRLSTSGMKKNEKRLEADYAGMEENCHELQALAQDCDEKRKLAHQLLDPVTDRCAGLQELGRRVHQLIISRVLRLKELEHDWDDSNPDGKISADIMANLFALVGGWKKIERDYQTETNNGTFEYEK